MASDREMLRVSGLIVPTFEGSADVGLRGVNVNTGAVIWQIDRACSRHATPAVWSHDRRQYVLAATVAGDLRLIDPRDGNVLWTVGGLGENHFSLTPTKDHVFVNQGSKTPRKEGDARMHGLLAAYRLGLDSAELVWQHDDDERLYFPTWMDSCARRSLAVADGQVYYYARSLDRTQASLFILDEPTGGVLAGLPFNSPTPHFYAVEDRLLMIRDASHRETELAFFSTDPRDFKQLADFWHPPHQNTTAYEVLMEHPIVQGRIYLRTLDGRIACYDLTQP